MILNHPLFSSSVDLSDHRVQQLVFENPDDMGRMISELHDYVDGRSSGFVTRYDGRELKRNEILLLTDPFRGTSDDKDIITGFIRSLKSILVSVENMLVTDSLMSDLQIHMMKATSDLDQSVDFQGIDIGTLLKASGITVNHDGDLGYRVCEHIRLSSKFTPMRLAIIVNLGSFISEHRYQEVIHQMEYYQVPVLFIDGFMNDGFARVKVMDSDFCEIDYVRDGNYFEV